MTLPGGAGQKFLFYFHIFRNCEMKFAGSSWHNHISGNVCTLISDIVYKFHFPLWNSEVSTHPYSSTYWNYPFPEFITKKNLVISTQFWIVLTRIYEKTTKIVFLLYCCESCFNLKCIVVQCGWFWKFCPCNTYLTFRILGHFEENIFRIWYNSSTLKHHRLHIPQISRHQYRRCCWAGHTVNRI